MSLNARKMFWVLILGLLLGCGVRGDPVPPEAPAVLGRGSPRYQDPARRLRSPALPSAKQLKLLDEQIEEEEQKRNEDGRETGQ